MSMLSAQCDKLRERAKELRSLAPYPAVPYLVPSTKETMALAMRSAASEMEDAADTIWELRGMVHKERAEADRLREERDMYRDLVDHMVHPDIPDQLAAENARLRKLVASVWRLFAEHGAVNPCDLPEVDAVRNDMRKLGVDG